MANFQSPKLLTFDNRNNWIDDIDLKSRLDFKMSGLKSDFMVVKQQLI